MGRRRRRAWVAAGAAVAISIAVVAVIAATHGTGSGGASGPVPPVTDSSSHAPADRVTTAEHLGCTTGDEPANFPLYSLGRSFRGLPLMAILRRCDRPYPGEPIRANFVSYIYGTCTPSGDEGCAPPLEVQVAPACERNWASYGDHSGRLETLRGVPAADLGGGQLELYAGASTIVIFAGSSAKARAAAKAIRAEPRRLAPDAAVLASKPTPGKLPPPVPGAMTGALRCTSPAAQG